MAARVVLAATLVATCVLPAAAQKPPQQSAQRPARLPSQREQKVLDSLFARFARPGAPGASVVVARDGALLVHRAFGLADVDAATPASTATNYRLASLTKQFTAMSILLLVDSGKLTLDQKVRTVLPELPAYTDAITLRHLLTHTSGLWDYEDFVPDTQRVQVTDADVLRLTRDRTDSLYFAPGSAWRYSNTGYALLALIVERTSGKRFADFLHERIFAPLGMAHTVAHIEGGDTITRRAYGHTMHGDTARRTDQSATSAVLGDGGIYSSIDDLMRWDAALRAGRLVRASLWREATTPFVLTSGKETTYGFGWFVETHLGRRRLRHHGETRGFTNAISKYPDDHLTIIVLTNRSDSAPWEIADRLAELYLK
jgi:CubicO group peptidase (beta-lactamase class C family)